MTGPAWSVAEVDAFGSACAAIGGASVLLCFVLGAGWPAGLGVVLTFSGQAAWRFYKAFRR